MHAALQKYAHSSSTLFDCQPLLTERKLSMCKGSPRTVSSDPGFQTVGMHYAGSLVTKPVVCCH